LEVSVTQSLEKSPTIGVSEINATATYLFSFAQTTLLLIEHHLSHNILSSLEEVDEEHQILESVHR
jgi:hypothetical protein